MTRSPARLFALLAAFGAAVWAGPITQTARAADEPKKDAAAADDQPIKALLVLGGCCHDYKAQKDILTKGISARANVQWTIAYDPDAGTKHLNPIYEKEDWYKGFDVVVHDECSADVKDLDVINRILKPHKEGLPAVHLHCAMHCYRSEGWKSNGPSMTPWFEFTGLQTTGHGAQKPIDVTYVDKDSPITKGLENWTTINEELYNNVAGKVLDTAKPLAKGKQGNTETVVVWTNEYNKKARVFGTTLGHNNQTVGDAKYLDLVTRGLLWSVDKLDEKHLKPAKQVMMDGAVNPPGAVKPAAPKAAAPTGPVPEDLARGKQATASSTQGGHSTADAVDGNSESRWCANGGKVPEWWQVDLGKPEDVTGCRITWEKDEAVYKYKVETSADGKVWAPAVDQTKANKPADQVREHKFAAKGVRYARVTVTGLGEGCWASFYEFELYGTKLVAPTAPTAVKPAGPKVPADQKALAGLKAPAGLDLSVFAAPPDVNYPTCLAATPAGDVFVGIDPDGSLGKEVGRGKVLLLKDTTGSGKADKIIEFAKMDHPRGLVWDAAARRLLVLHPPFLSAYTDENGDGVADKSEVLINGISVPQTVKARGADHTTNGIRLGIDGWVYIAMGDFGCDAVGKDGTKLKLHSGGVVRVRPDGSGLEVYAHHTRNLYDVAIDPYMNVFTRDNTNDGDGWNDRLAYAIPTGNYGYPSLFKHFPGEFVDCLTDFGGGSPCGSLFTDEPALPEPWAHSFLTVEWGRSTINHHPLTPDGASYKRGVPDSKLMDLPRGTDIDADGSGRLYASSWANGGFSYSGANVGFVIRLTATGAKPAAFPDLAKATDEQLIGYLAYPSGVCRISAQREILHRGDKPAFATGLEKLAGSNGLLQGRVAALFTLKLLRGAQADAALANLAKLPEVREWALRALLDDPKDTTAPTAPFVDGLKDPNPRVRLVAAWGVGRLNKAEAAAALVPAANDADFLVSHVAQNSLVALNAAAPCLKAVDPATPTLMPGALLALQQMHDPAVVDGLTGKLPTTFISDPAQRGAIYRALCRLYYKEADWDLSWWGTRPDTAGPYFKTAVWAGTDKVKQALQSALTTEKPEVVRGLVGDLQKHKINFPEMSALVAKAAATDPAAKAALLDSLAGRKSLTPEQLKIVQSIAASDKEPAAQRVKAIRLLTADPKDAAALEAAVDALAPTVAAEKPDAELAAALEEFVRDPRNANNLPYFTKLTTSDSAPKRELAWSAVVAVANSRLAKAESKAAAGKVVEKGFDKPATAVPLLRAIGRTKADGYQDWIEAMATDPNADLAKAAGFAAGRLGMKGVKVAGPKVLIEAMQFEQVVEQVKQDKGDAALGGELFTRQGCVACHTTAADQPPKGPLLAGVAVKYSRAELCESIMKPSAKIAQGFETQWFKTGDDDMQEGFVTREAGDEVELRNVAGIVTVLKKSDIKKRGKRDTSVMPEGLVVKLSPHELASIVAYLESISPKPK